MRLLFVILFLISVLNIKAQTDLDIQISNEEKVNTAGWEFSPAKWQNQIIFVSSQDPENNYFDLKFSAPNIKAELIRSAKMPAIINSPLHEGPVCFHQESNTLYFTRTNQLNNKKQVDENGKIRLQIFYTEFIEGNWSKPKKLEINQDNGSYCHPTISSDGKTMILASDFGQEENKMDLYLIKKSQGEWGSPQRLEQNINTSQNDWFPYLHPKGYLFYATKGKTEDQGLDIFISELKADSFSNPKPLNFPINSNFDDFGIYLNEQGTRGYLSSNRPGGMGQDDIYKFESNLDLLDIYSDRSSDKTDIDLMKQKSMDNKETIEVEKNTAIAKKNVSSYKVGSIIYNNQLSFNPDNTLRISSIDVSFLEMIDQLKNDDNLKIQISAHTNSKGSELSNQQKTELEANSILNYLVNQGVDKSKIFALGFGESRLRNHCENGVSCSEAEHKLNDRIEFKILDN